MLRQGMLDPPRITIDPTQWPYLGTPAPRDLSHARLGMHWAAQIVSAAGATLAPPRDDASHTSLEWLETHGALAGPLVSDARLRAALRCRNMALLVLNETDEVLATLALPGQRLDEAMAWLARSFTAHGAPRVSLRRPEHDLPDHPVRKGAVFVGNSAAAQSELSKWFGTSAAALRSLSPTPNGPVRAWPHHFDIAALALLDDAPDESARSIGIGMTPGDGSYDEPYFYVTPWPYPDAPTLPELPAGHWHRDAWLGAVLTRSEIVARRGAGSPAGAAAQAARVQQFFDAAIEISHLMLRP